MQIIHNTSKCEGGVCITNIVMCRMSVEHLNRMGDGVVEHIDIALKTQYLTSNAWLNILRVYEYPYHHSGG